MDPRSNPPDKYIDVPLTGDSTIDLAAINAQANLGYRLNGFMPTVAPFPWVAVMGNYQEPAL